MSRNKRRNLAAGIACALLLILAWFLYSDSWQILSARQRNTITVGLFSDSYWEVPNGYSYRILDDAIRVFEEAHPQAQVKYVSGVMKEDYAEWLSERLLSGDAPDLFFVLPDDFNDMAELGVLKNLTSFMEDDAGFDREAFYSSAYAYGQFEGQQYSLPYECAPRLMFVNKSILDREGLAIPEDGWTLDDFYEICEKVTKDTDGDGLLDQFGVVGYTWQDAFTSKGIELFGQDGRSCSLTGDQVEEAVAFMEKLTALNGGYSITNRDFDRGNVVFQPMLFSEYRAYQSYPLSVKKYSGFEWGCIPMPSSRPQTGISGTVDPRTAGSGSLDVLLLAMNARTKKGALAWEFMKVLTCDPRIQSEIFEYSEGVSVLRKVTESDETLERLMEASGDAGSMNQEILSSAVEHAAVEPRFRNYDDAVAEVDRALTEIISSDSNIGMELIIRNRAINKKLKNNRW